MLIERGFVDHKSFNDVWMLEYRDFEARSLVTKSQVY